MFSKNRHDCLSDSALNKVMIFRDITVQEVYSSSINGSCPSYNQRWTMYDPEIEQYTGPIRDVTVEEEIHILKLYDWRSKVKTNTPVSMTRGHKLIKDAGPNVHPDGFFDCTVEILHKHRDECKQGTLVIYSVYVTDYTSNENLPVLQGDGEWRCPETLQDKVLKIEMWDSAVATAEKMNAGDFYSITNVKMRISRDNCWEGKYLVALLNRRDAWNASQDELERNTLHPRNHALLQDAEPDKIFHCIAEVVHVSKESHSTYLYVTDYTARDGLVPIYIAPKPKVEGKQLQILTLSTGNVIYIKKLKLQRLPGVARAADGSPLCYVSGTLEGDEMLIQELKLGGQGTGDEYKHLGALLRRKQEYEEFQQGERN
ncbi:telombin family protein [Abortiporus biennis]